MKTMTMHPAKAYLLFECVRGFALAMSNTVYGPFLISLHFSYAQIALLNAFFQAAITMAELPTGMLADGRSRLWSIRVGMFSAAVAATIYAFAQGFWSALCAEVTMGVAFAFLSGAQQAWIVDALDHLQEGHRRQTVFAQAAFVRGIGVVVGGVIGAWIGAWQVRAAWAGEAIGAFLAFGVTLWCMHDQGEPVHRVSEVAALQKSAALLRGHTGLQWAVAVALTFGLVLPFNHYWTPFFAEKVGQANLGWLWIPMYAALSSAGLLVRSGKLIFRGANGVSLALFLAGTSLAGMGLASGLITPLVFLLLHEVARGLYEPTLDLYIHHHVESSYRATYGSLQSFLGRMSYFLILLIIWFFTRNKASNIALIRQLWFIAGGLLTICVIVLWLRRPRD